ncbi:hypothetical protein [Streptomyces flavidovirens]|uniref:hypothetical protein n=1 Tax=Streptomyces flavidovirens TaxID=67298 RepID=UPI0012FF514D|nr:hypothetical protein [Streptomyces flavidovirens]
MRGSRVYAAGEAKPLRRSAEPGRQGRGRRARAGRGGGRHRQRRTGHRPLLAVRHTVADDRLLRRRLTPHWPALGG